VKGRVSKKTYAWVEEGLRPWYGESTELGQKSWRKKGKVADCPRKPGVFSEKGKRVIQASTIKV